MRVRAAHKNQLAQAMTAEQLTDTLAEKVMRWTTAPDRFLLGNRQWIPTWRFQPTKNISDAFQLFEAADVVKYVLRVDSPGVCWVKVWTNVASAEASGPTLPLTICFAIARACGIDVEAA